MPSERDIISESYILRESVGGDAFAEWWRASSIYHASNYLVRFVREGYCADEAARAAFAGLAKARVDSVSPSILGLVEVGSHKGRPFLVSDYEDHRNLRSILDSGKRFSVEHACRLSIALAEGVDSFHQRGESYGALSPESVAVHQTGGSIDEMKLLLPGYEPLFAAVPSAELADYVSSWGYASPELKKGKPANARSDLYSLGVLLFRLLVGKLPYGSRSGAKVRDRSASPSHVAAALARRGMPKELAAAVVRSLRRNPELRHPDALSFITELRAILDVRREAWIRAGKVDPIAELATLNLKKAKADAKEIVRSLETVNYFRFIADSGSAPEWRPIETVEADEKTLELEEAEAERDDDDDSIATDAYVESGYRAAGEPKRQQASPSLPGQGRPAAAAAPIATAQKAERPAPRVEAPLAVLEPMAASAPPAPEAIPNPAPTIAPASYWNAAPTPPIGSTPVTTTKPTTAPFPADAAAAAQPGARQRSGRADSEDSAPGGSAARPSPTGTAKPLAAPPPESEAGRAGPGTVSPPTEPRASSEDPGARPPSAKRRSVPIRWKPSGGSPRDVVARMAAAVDKAKAGTGLVRFIESPSTPEAAKAIAEGLDGLRLEAELVDLGALEPGLALDGLMERMDRALGRLQRSLGDRAEPKGYVARANPAGGTSAVSAAAKRKAKGAVEAIIAGLNPERPLVLIARGAASISPSAHEFFVKLAKAAVRAPLCAFLFFGPGPIPDWHVLAKLKRTRRRSDSGEAQSLAPQL